MAIPKRIEIHSIAKGAYGEIEDRWRLVIKDDGRSHVEHEWSRHDPYGSREPDTGVTSMPVEEFLADKQQNAIARNHPGQHSRQRGRDRVMPPLLH
jgi:hypothetical protein